MTTERHPCEACEELLQGYLDRELSDTEAKQAEGHLDGCDYCRRRYRFGLTSSPARYRVTKRVTCARLSPVIFSR